MNGEDHFRSSSKAEWNEDEERVQQRLKRAELYLDQKRGSKSLNRKVQLAEVSLEGHPGSNLR